MVTNAIGSIIGGDDSSSDGSVGLEVTSKAIDAVTVSILNKSK